MLKFIKRKIKRLQLKRQYYWFLQRKKTGFDDREVYNLFQTIGKFVLPRLERFRDTTFSRPPELTEEEWKKSLDDMIFAINYAVNCDELDFNYTTKELRRIKRGFRLFGTYFMNLWI